MTSSSPETRASLILRLRDAADVVAWDEFTEVYAPVVFRVARRQGLQPADADDLVQEVLCAVARTVTQWIERDDRGSFRAWLFRIARNMSINFLTRRRYQPWSRGGDLAVERFAAIEASDVSSEFDMEYRREIFTRASEIVRGRVSPTTWKAFYRTSVEQQSVDAVAQQLGVSPGSVYIARSRVLKRLRSVVETFQERSDDDV
ncbi:RNA polymerase sigma factor [Roseimaritima ulvae]|uniref:ECF RNA polymerase sigma factor SigE n=1 Tax=Roseimaritima ulvae TaxID=980254 RepID=A0A5B9QVY0_9BACT|nr:sigma-70 family RNA polymerase sigma factor [Roseimaritima ulvae]QEG43197.1 ECF RNA polymerase sigma factor SigE [Roseimaritima ulvae]